MRYHYHSIIVALAALLVTLGLQPARAANGKSSLTLIREAYDQGKLTEQQRLLYSVESIKRPGALPVEYQSNVIDQGRCATPVLLEVRQQWNKLDGSTRDALSSMLTRPSQTYSIVSPEGHFRIHYDLSGSNAVPSTDVDPADGIPDFVQWIADYADSSYRTEIIGLGQLTPPADGTLGGDSLYDIYTEEMPYYGYTQPEGAGPEPWNDAYSYISVHRNFIGFPPNTDPDGNQKGAAKVTVAHEFYHAIQFAYDVGEQVWFMETSSTWMEDYVYDVVNDNYNYLPTLFNDPDWSLHSITNGHMYSAFIWGKYLQENFGAQTFPDIWNQLITTSPYPAFSTVLAAKGATVPQEVAEFWAWNYVTASRNDGNHYEEAENYPLIAITRTHSTYPVSDLGPVTGKYPDGMGANYIVFNIPSDAFSFTVDFDGEDGVSWIVTMLARNTSTNDYTEYQMPLDGSGAGEFTLSPVGDKDELAMVIANVSQTLDNRNYSYGADYVSSPAYAIDVSSIADDSVYSNSTVTVKFSVENVGLQPDDFDITVADQLGWPVSPTSGSLSLNSGQTGQFNVVVTAPPSAAIGSVNSITLTAQASSVVGVSDSDSGAVEVFLQHGDSDQSGSLSISDGVYLVNYIFGGGPAPTPALEAGDANCDGSISIADAVFLINYIFGGGPYPPCNAIQG